MTTVQRRAQEIYDVEDFDIIVKRDGQPVDPKTNGLMKPYPFDKKLRHTKTVEDWKQGRFRPNYPGLDCDVLDGDGNVVAGQTSLRTVRESYEEEE